MSGHVHRDDFGSRLGMWLFLVTEMVLFGGLFIGLGEALAEAHAA